MPLGDWLFLFSFPSVHPPPPPWGLPAGSEGLPTGCPAEALPNSTEALPAVFETLLAGSEALSADFETHPVCSAALLAS